MFAWKKFKIMFKFFKKGKVKYEFYVFLFYKITSTVREF